MQEDKKPEAVARPVSPMQPTPVRPQIPTRRPPLTLADLAAMRDPDSDVRVDAVPQTRGREKTPVGWTFSIGLWIKDRYDRRLLAGNKVLPTEGEAKEAGEQVIATVRTMTIAGTVEERIAQMRKNRAMDAGLKISK
ncbi:MAG: hypothetical protein ABIH03_14410 [Pseudomonadota bacterium]